MDVISPISIIFRDEVTPANDDTGDWMALPATKEQLQQELARTDTDNRMAGRIQPTDIASPYSWLSDVITDEVDTNELNYLAAKISKLDGEGLDKLEAVVESGRHRGINGVGNDIADIINIIQNLDSFTFHPDMDEMRYGEELLSDPNEVIGRKIRQLQNSISESDQEFATFVDCLRECADAEQFGKSMAQNNDGEFLDSGYLIEDGGFSEEYYGMEDIPDEYRIWEQSETFIKVVDVDLPPLLLEMHALGGNYTQDAAKNLQVLMSGDCFIAVKAETLTVLPAAEVFRMDSSHYNAFISACSGHARVFFAAMSEDGDGGNIHEIIADAIMESVYNLKLSAVIIDVEFKDGTNGKFSPSDWNELPESEKSRAAGLIHRYDSYNEKLVDTFLNDLRELSRDGGKVITQEDFLAQLNAPFMARTQNAQPDMLRVARETARDMVARSDAEVYRLMPEGAVALTPIDVVKSNGLWFKEHREFAIKPGGMSGLRKWANRTADDIARQSLRETLHKSQDKSL